MEFKHNAGDLLQRQQLPLSLKIKLSKRRILEWYTFFDGDVYVSFSGGKDSTVLLHLVRQTIFWDNVEAVFIDTGLEYPEIREFVKKQSNVTIIRPELNFKQVIQKYGYPVPSKEISRKIYYARQGATWAQKFIDGSAVDAEGRPSRYRVAKKWLPLLEAPFKVSAACCDIMKKHPAHKFDRETGKKAYVGTLACESELRKQAWLRDGCNAFDIKNPRSAPLSFWTENDILTYIKENNLEIASIYGDIIETGKMLPSFEVCDQPHLVPELTTTNAERTGCMFCMFGCHLEKEPNRFQRMKITHPKQYEFCLKPIEEGGLGLKAVLDYIGVKYE